MSSVDTVLIGSGVGAVLPLLTAVVQQPAWSARVKRLVAVVASLVAGVATVAASEGLEGVTTGGPAAFGTVLAVLAASQAAFDLVWKPSKVSAAIERKTSVSGPAPGA